MSSVLRESTFKLLDLAKVVVRRFRFSSSRAGMESAGQSSSSGACKPIKSQDIISEDISVASSGSIGSSSQELAPSPNSSSSSFSAEVPPPDSEVAGNQSFFDPSQGEPDGRLGSIERTASRCAKSNG